MSIPATPLPPLPPPPPPAPTVPHPTRPNVASEGPPGALQLELLIHNGYPFKDHWAFRVRSHENNDVGVVFHATGDVRNGFIFEIKRNFDFRRDLPIPSQIIPLQWIDKENFDEGPMFAGDIGVASFDYEPLATSAFEVSLYKVNPPGKSLNTVSNSDTPLKKVAQQRDCQTWIVESADQLVKDGILRREVADYLRFIKQ
ncbi:hypothetical protein AGABI2DRAFT_187122 [Agaricus bisporus var. bisporus H97]|uniref:hypothetical protein n=1 Tax=Agaricus bisporus var. bisporus (strain H97 / ATCC MYA-4626 / FGSC 10389) TaxID=936046 RepID=UPI00029F77CB|nr:hypothetical protein AGABI2DRAFT_187122 [Agaricus bisporus var. bisporus H97]EKV45414.1 hypothetical protein AGABI2DRAFT_187122 [Agaricus bisporus var. bisporus H97]